MRGGKSSFVGSPSNLAIRTRRLFANAFHWQSSFSDIYRQDFHLIESTDWRAGLHRANLWVVILKRRGNPISKTEISKFNDVLNIDARCNRNRLNSLSTWGRASAMCDLPPAPGKEPHPTCARAFRRYTVPFFYSRNLRRQLFARPLF